MARGRMLNQTVATDKKLNALSVEAELLYLKTIPHLDRDGLILGDPMLLWAKVCPRRPGLMGKVNALVDELIASELVIAYQAGDEQILFFVGFSKNQANMRYEREPASTYPAPPGFRRTPKGLEPMQLAPVHLTPTFAGSLPEVCRNDAGSLPPEEKRREEKIREENSAPAVVVGGSELPTVTAADVHTLWQSNMPGTLSPIIVEELDDLIETYTPGEVDTAIRLAVSAGKRNIRYVNGILKRRATGEDKPQAAIPKVPPVGVSGDLGFSLNSI